MLNYYLITKNKTWFLFLSFLVLIPFQNCTPMHSSTEEGYNESSSVTPETTQAARFNKAMGVIQAKCLSCHSASGSASFASFDLTDEQDFVSRGYVVAGDVNRSNILLRSLYSGASNGNMPVDGRPYSRNDFMDLYYWVRDMNVPDAIVVTPPPVTPPPTTPPTTPPPVVKSPAISSFNIVNAQTGQVVQQGVLGAVNFNLSQVGFDIKIVANGNNDVASINFSIIGSAAQSFEDNSVPYEIYPNGFRLMAGSYTFEATPYSETGLMGVQGTKMSIAINVVDDTTPPPPNPLDLAINGFNLINADTDTVYTSGVSNNITLQLSQIGFNMNVEAIVGVDTQSVELTLTGDMTHTQQESLAPFALFPQPTVTDYDGRLFGPGIYVVTARAYENKSLMGQMGLPMSLTITVVDDTPPPPINHLAEAIKVLNQYCVGCHSPSGTAGQYPLNFLTDAEFINSGMVVPGDIDNSKLITRTIHYSGSGVGPQNMPKGTIASSFTTAHYQTLVDWVNQMSNVPTPPPTNFQPFACTNVTSASHTESYTLTKKQYTNTLEDLFGTAVINNAQNLLALVPDDSFDKHSHDRLNGLSRQLIDTYHRIALNIANQVTGSSNLTSQVFGSCANQTSPAASCIDGYLNGFAQRIFRRPLNSTELSYARNLVNGGGSYKNQLNHLLAYHLQSPYFIIRVELGNANDTTANYEISPYEIASRIAFQATDSAPDSQLLSKAADGSIRNISTMKAETRRLLMSARGRQKVKSTLMSWSHMDRTQAINQLPTTLLSQFYAGGLDQAMIKEAEDFVEYIVFERQGNFQDLLTSKASFASDPELAQIYQHAPANPLRQPGSATALVTGRRQGLLLRAPAMTSDIPRARSIHRGVDFQASIMCNELPSPPSNIFDTRFDMALTPTQLLDTTTRDNVHHLTNDVNCMSCHASINATGFAFENFGPFGELRSQEQIFDNNGNFHQNLAIDSTATVPTWSGQTVAVNDAMDLVNHMAAAPEAHACFSRKMFRHLQEKRETVEDDCHLDQMYQQVKQSGSLLDGFVNIIANEPNKRKRR